jgi:predicted O-methyltransferase YrrM
MIEKIGSVLEGRPLGLGALGEVLTQMALYRKLRFALSDLRSSCARAASLHEVVEATRSSSVFHSDQKQLEIVGLLRILQENPPRYVCEIGSACGGTLFLLAKMCHPDALIISIDLGITVERSVAHSHFGNAHQRLVSIRADSRAAGTLRRVRSLLKGHQLDLLFIDGDHSYQGVKADFENYSPLVREGGLAVFHDIVPDFRTRFGTPTINDTGEVPRFWSEIKQHHRTTEIIEDVQQDGYGVGIVHM